MKFEGNIREASDFASRSGRGLLDAVDYYEVRERGAGIRLMEAVRTAVAKIENHPDIGARYNKTANRFYA